MKASQPIINWSSHTSPGLINWHRAMVHAQVKHPEKWFAFIRAGQWIRDLNHLRTASQENAAYTRRSLESGIEVEVRKSLKTGNADFFRHFADALEIKAQPICGRRQWFVMKHIPRDGEIPSFTHDQLLDDAKRHGITGLSYTQLDRLMKEFKPYGFRYKNSRR